MQKFLAAVLVGLLLGACGDKNPHEMRLPRAGEVDWCGYTWEKKFPASDVVEYRSVPSWQDMPAGCKPSPQLFGCHEGYTSDGKRRSRITLRQGVDVAAGDSKQCSWLMHEQMHAFGYDHREDHSHMPRDFTR